MSELMFDLKYIQTLDEYFTWPYQEIYTPISNWYQIRRSVKDEAVETEDWTLNLFNSIKHGNRKNTLVV